MGLGIAVYIQVARRGRIAELRSFLIYAKISMTTWCGLKDGRSLTVDSSSGLGGAVQKVSLNEERMSSTAGPWTSVRPRGRRVRAVTC
jgi:hypothetical protein